MKNRLVGMAVTTTFSLAVAMVAVLPAGAAGPQRGPAFDDDTPRAERACAATVPDEASCMAWISSDVASGQVTTLATPTGLSPAAIKAVYGWSTSMTAGTGKTVAIVDAYHDPTAASDLAVFSKQYGLPACTVANGCFTQVSQTGTNRLPATNALWAFEISLDIQMVHAIAPGAKILLVEAKSANLSDLMIAEDYASSKAAYVSNSWDTTESAAETTYDSHFTTPGVSYFVAAGDSGLPALYPSSSPNVISVGGTTLNFTGGVFSSETGWAQGGGGCSAFETASVAQAAFSQYPQTACAGKRSTPDVSLVADPASGVSVYDSTAYNNQKGWFKVGGTSVGAPLWAARSAVAGALINASFLYGGAIPFRDIISGGNTGGCLLGFDLCSGRGSWVG
jgi:hypothetical protein